MALIPGVGPSKNAGSGGGNRNHNMRSADRSARLKIGGILKYSMLPGIVPRVKRLGERFGAISYMLAMIFASAGLLPKGHPMLRGVNYGRFGVVDVVAAAANNVTFDRRNIDRVLMFGAIVLSLIMVVMQVVLIAIYAIFSNTAQASNEPYSTSGMFTTANPNQDTVMSFLQQVIGIPGFFNAEGELGFPIANALHRMLGYYSTGLLVIAVMIVLYYIVTVVGEAAKTGQPFGGRFNSLWAPVRLVIALGMLVPFGSGLNASQYVILYTAKAGSSFATNAWIEFSRILADPEKTTIPPYPSGMGSVAKQVFLMEVCRAANNKSGVLERDKVQVIATLPNNELYSKLSGALAPVNPDRTMQWIRGDGVQLTWVGSPTGSAMGIGSADKSLNCGKLTFPYKGGLEETPKNELAFEAYSSYMQAVGKIITAVRPVAEKIADFYVLDPEANMSSQTSYGNLAALSGIDGKFLIDVITQVDKDLFEKFVGGGEGDFESQYSKKIMSDALGTPQQLALGGWGSAGSFYTRLAFANQTIQQTIKESLPSFEVVKAQGVEQTDTCIISTILGCWNNDAYGERVEFVAAAVNSADLFITQQVGDLTRNTTAGIKRYSANWEADSDVMKFIKDVFMVDSLQAMAENNQVFPMVHLVNLGSELMSKALSGFVVGTLVSTVFPAVGGFILFIGLMGITLGFMLGIVLPLLPFIYFFFAVVEWVMGVVEGLVGAPLWALAHLRIDGDGMPGPAASQGYFYLLGILLKPILILFALLASYIVFNAGAYFLNLVFGGALQFIPPAKDNFLGAFNIPNFSVLGVLQFVGYLVTYAIIIYNLGMVCFKMIDQLPLQVMRWMGQGNVHYNDGKPDPIGSISSAAGAAGAFAAGKLSSAASGAANQAGRGLKGVAQKGAAATKAGSKGEFE